MLLFKTNSKTMLLGLLLTVMFSAWSACTSASPTPEAELPTTASDAAPVAPTAEVSTPTAQPDPKPVNTPVPSPTATLEPTATPTVAAGGGGLPSTVETELSPTSNPYAELETSLQWVDGTLSSEEQSGLEVLKDLFDQDVSLALALSRVVWVQDNLDTVEVQFLRVLGEITRIDSSLSATIIRYPWIADGVEVGEKDAIAAIKNVVNASPQSSRQLKEFAWIADGIGLEEQDLLALWEELSLSDASYAIEMIAMPAFSSAVEGLEVEAAYSLTNLREQFPSQYRKLSQAPWFSRGIDGTNAPLVYALLTEAEIGSYFDQLLDTFRAESISFQTPLGVNMTIYSYTYKRGSGLSYLRRMEQSITSMESLVGSPFPAEDLVYIFALPGEDEAEGWNYGTHVLLKHAYSASVPNQFTLGILSFYYWDSTYLEGAHVAGVPHWFERGAIGFMADYTLDQQKLASLENQHGFLENLVTRYCRNLAMSTIERINEDISLRGLDKHRDSDPGACSGVIGEVFFLNLFDAMGLSSFSRSWSEIHRMSQLSSEPVTEEQIYHAFLDNADAASAGKVKEMYSAWHGRQF